MSRTNRLFFIDLLKVAAILMVISLHVPVWSCDFIQNGTNCLPQYAMRMLSEGVPLFMAVNGFLMFRRKSFDLRMHMRRMLRIFILVLIWAVIFTLFRGEMLSVFKTPEGIIRNILTMKLGAYRVGGLWYLQNLLGVYFLYPALKLVYDQDRRLYLWMYAVIFFFAGGIDSIGHVRDLINALAGRETVFTELPEFLARFGPVMTSRWYCVFFMTGGVIAAFEDRVRKHAVRIAAAGAGAWILAFLFGVATSYVSGKMYDGVFLYHSVLEIPVLFGWFALAMLAEGSGRPNSLFRAAVMRVGSLTLGFYLIHFLVVYWLSLIYVPTGLIGRCAAWAMIFFATWGIAEILSRIPVLKYLIRYTKQ